MLLLLILVTFTAVLLLLVGGGGFPFLTINVRIDAEGPSEMV